MSDNFSQDLFFKYNDTWQLMYYEETDSTNLQAKKAIESSSLSSGSAVITDHQTRGKGRRENQWESERGKDLLFTAVIETALPAQHLHKVATATALTVANVLSDYLPSVQVKFPNDVYVSGKKIAGILIEHVQEFTLIGIGLNVNSSPMIEDATSLIVEKENMLGKGDPIYREIVLAKILHQLIEKISLCEVHFSKIAHDLISYDFLFNRSISFIRNQLTEYATAKGLSENGYLLIDQGKGISELMTGHTFRLIDESV